MKKVIRTLFDFFEWVFIGAAVCIIAYFFVGQPLEVSGTSMLPNFKDKEQIIAEKLSTKYMPLKRGEVLVFRHKQNGLLLIKRVLGLPGDTVMLSEGHVYINGTQLEEAYLEDNTKTSARAFLGENISFKIDPDEYIVMGDNRSESTDSRDWGTVSKENIVGRAILIYYPIKDFRLIIAQ